MRSCILIILLATFNSSPPELSCINSKGENVDWYIILSFPKTSNNGKATYAYFDNKSNDITYLPYQKTTYPPLRLIKYFNNKRRKTSYIIWNDGASGNTTTKAHSKGALLYNNTSGVLLSHSMPKFPIIINNKFIKDLPDGSDKHGQHFICISTDHIGVLSIVKSLGIINPAIVAMYSDDDNNFRAEFSRLTKTDKDAQDYEYIIIQSIRGTPFHIFSKGRDHINIPYDVYIPQYYEDRFFINTWTRPKQLESLCNTKLRVMNVRKLKFGEFEFDSNQEHSKWAVSSKSQIICFGDLNRTESQKNRAGNTFCFYNSKLAKVMREAIIDFDKCGYNEDL
jgi:deoxyribonuclease-2